MNSDKGTNLWLLAVVTALFCPPLSAQQAMTFDSLPRYAAISVFTEQGNGVQISMVGRTTIDNIVAVPEPHATWLLVAGLAGVFVRSRTRRNWTERIRETES